MPIAEVAITLAYLVSLVLAADQPTTMMASDRVSMMSGMRAQDNNVMVSESDILIYKSDREALTHTIEDMIARNPNVVTITNEDLFGLLTRAAANPALYNNAAGIVSAASSGNTGALANNAVGLLGAVLPSTPTTPEPVSEPGAASSAAVA